MGRDGMAFNRPMRFLFAVLAVLAGWSTLWVLGQFGEEGLRSARPSPTPPASAGGRAPLVTGSVYLCPPGWPYAAYAARAYHYYPPNHPLFPDRQVQPDRCYATPTRAEKAGYTLALPPQGSVIVDGVYLVPMDYQTFELMCDRASRRLGFAVPCPMLMPNPGLGSGPPRCGDPASFGRYTRPACVYDRAFLLDQAGFAVPPGYGAGAFGGSHLVISAFRRKALGADPDARYALECPETRRVGWVQLSVPDLDQDVRAVLLTCPSGPPPLGGHVILRWSQSGIVYQVALNGDIPANRRLLEAIASSMQIIGPAQGSSGS
jgi:hypothetical protein